MGRLFFLLFNIIGPITTVVQLFLPLYLKTDIHYDMNRRKFAFAVYIFGFLRIVGGYVATYPGGLAIHITKQTAFLLPYSEMNKERKKYSFLRSFRLRSLLITTETGAEYLSLVALAHAFLRVFFFAKGGEKRKIENNLWLTNGDVLRISVRVVLQFTMFILLRNAWKVLKEKMKELWQKKTEKSTH